MSSCAHITPTGGRRGRFAPQLPPPSRPPSCFVTAPAVFASFPCALFGHPPFTDPVIIPENRRPKLPSCYAEREPGSVPFVSRARSVTLTSGRQTVLPSSPKTVLCSHKNPTGRRRACFSGPVCSESMTVVDVSHALPRCRFRLPRHNQALRPPTVHALRDLGDTPPGLCVDASVLRVLDRGRDGNTLFRFSQTVFRILQTFLCLCINERHCRITYFQYTDLSRTVMSVPAMT
jgi:hypothetical protein